MEPMASEGEGSLPVISTNEAAKLHVANMMRLCKDLRLPVAFKVWCALGFHSPRFSGSILGHQWLLREGDP
eukprot:1161925-Pelagomonas_calceolata.AAC.2